MIKGIEKKILELFHGDQEMNFLSIGILLTHTKDEIMEFFVKFAREKGDKGIFLLERECEMDNINNIYNCGEFAINLSLTFVSYIPGGVRDGNFTGTLYECEKVGSKYNINYDKGSRKDWQYTRR